jgi:hypothetical protein
MDNLLQHHNYGLEGMKIDLNVATPSFMHKSKQFYGSANFLGHVSGIAPDANSQVQIGFSIISDAYGAFGWYGVILVPLIGFTMVFVLYNNMFPDLNSEWAVVALALLVQNFGEILLGKFFLILIRIPLQILLLSYVLGYVARFLSMKRDRLFEQAPGALSAEDTVSG